MPTEETLNQGADTSSAQAENNSTQASTESHSAESSAVSDANTAASSTADAGAKGSDTLLKVLKNAGKENETEQSPSSQEGKAASQEPNAQKGQGEEAKEDESQVPFHNHPRWKKIQGEKAALTKELETIKPMAQVGQSVTQFMQRAGLSNQEINRTFEIAAMIKNDPARGFAELQKVMHPLAQFMGHQLPNDLQQAVNAGQITAQHAQQLAQARHQLAWNNQRQQQQAQEAQRQQQIAAQKAFQSRIEGTLVNWENQTRSSDADYPKIAKQLERAVRIALTEKPPRSEQEAVDTVNACYKEIKAEYASLVPVQRRQPISPTRSANTSTRGQAKPTSMLEAVRMGVANASA